MEHVLTGGLQGGDGAAVEGVVEGDDGGTTHAVLVKAVLSSQLDDALVGFAAAVGEEHGGHAGALAQLFGYLGVRLGVEQVGGVLKLLCLLADRLHPGGVAVAQAGDTDAAGEIGVDLSLQAVQGRALAVV